MTDAPRQTITYLTRRFRAAGLQPDVRHGQNFLVDLNLVEFLARHAELTSDDVVLEVGTGLGSLTGMLAARAGAVVTVEIDPHVFRLAEETLAGLPNVTLLQQDALKNKHRLHPRVYEVVAEKLAEAPGRRFKVAANLPYNVATPVLSNLLEAPMGPPETMTVTIQRELADRLVAPPGCKDYSALTVWMQSQCAIEILRVLSPDVFWPKPKVHSAIIRIRPDAEKRSRLPEREAFHAFVRSMFFHRRKFLRSELIAATKDRLDKPAVDAILAAMGLGADARAEQLSVERMLELFGHVEAAAPRKEEERETERGGEGERGSGGEGEREPEGEALT